MTQTDHDPGADAANERARPLEAVAAEPIERRRLARPRRHRILDGPDDDRGRRLLPEGRRQRRGAARLLRLVVPGRRGRRDLLRPAGRADRPALGRADAAGLHVRHQGPRPDDRAGDRDAAPAEGDPRGAPGRAPGEDRGSTPRTSRPSSTTRSGGCSARPWRRSRNGPARLDPAPVPEVGLPVEREPGTDR